MIVMCVCQHEVSVNDNADQFIVDMVKTISAQNVLLQTQKYLQMVCLN